MANRNLIITLAKVIIAAAWADGDVSHEERNSLKDLLFRLPQVGLDRGMQLTTREWQTLEMYMHSPIEPDEKQRLIEELQIATQTFEDKKLVFEALNELAAADGDLNEEEKGMISEVKRAINDVNTNVFNQMGKLVGFAMQRRSQTAANSFNREHQLEDFIKNKVYYAASQRLRQESFSLDVSDEDLRRLSLAGGLMAKVAHVDMEVTEAEFQAMVEVLQKHWGVGEETAVFIAEVATSEVADHLDHHRTVREFGVMTEPAERVQFLNLLFAIANADGFVTYDEIEEIRAIAKSMNVIHEDFIQAKLTIPKEQRAT